MFDKRSPLLHQLLVEAVRQPSINPIFSAIDEEFAVRAITLVEELLGLFGEDGLGLSIPLGLKNEAGLHKGLWRSVSAALRERCKTKSSDLANEGVCTSPPCAEFVILPCIRPDLVDGIERGVEALDRMPFSE